MKVPQLARYNGTVSKAYEFVEDNITTFPLNPFEIINKFKWGLLTYKEMASKEHCSIKDICDCIGNDGYSIYNGRNYTIAYNNTIKSEGRINFTLAHEIGHIILNHHKDFEVTEILQDNFTKEEYKILENEANCFARNILAPAPLVKQMKLWNMLFDMPNYFGMSFKASTTRIAFFNNDLYSLNDEQIDKFQKNYKMFKQCPKCTCGKLKTDYKYCPICGKELIKGDGFTMKEYKGINIKELGECPICENVDVQESHKFCKICGIPLINKCSVCNHELDLSARYCTECGGASMFFVTGLLKNWQNATDATKIVQAFEPVFSTSSDDLPF